MRTALHDDVCKYCRKPIWGGETQIGTSPFWTGQTHEWIHDVCIWEIRAELKTQEAVERAVAQSEVATAALPPGSDEQYRDPRKLIDVSTAAQRLNCSATTVRQMAKRGEIIMVIVGNRRQQILESSVDQYIDSFINVDL